MTVYQKNHEYPHFPCLLHQGVFISENAFEGFKGYNLLNWLQKEGREWKFAPIQDLDSERKNKKLNASPISTKKSRLKTAKILKFAATILAVAGAVASLFYLADNFFNHPSKNILLDTADPFREMSNSIESFGDLNQLKKINGVPIEVIEERGKPGGWSGGGFLSNNEKLIDVMAKDWRTVGKLGTTHIELSNHLQSIWETVDKSNYYQDNFSMSYDPSLLKGNTIHSKPQQLMIKRTDSTGWQNDIFTNMIDGVRESIYIPPNNDTDIDSEEELEGRFLPFISFPTHWGSDIEIKNLKTGEGILVAKGVIDYIGKYGFYEGGKGNKDYQDYKFRFSKKYYHQRNTAPGTNDYRIDPIRLVGVLTGLRYCKIARAINEPCES